jgi:hypothetical protein
MRWETLPQLLPATIPSSKDSRLLWSDITIGQVGLYSVLMLA